MKKNDAVCHPTVPYLVSLPPLSHTPPKQYPLSLVCPDSPPQNTDQKL